VVSVITETARVDILPAHPRFVSQMNDVCEEAFFLFVLLFALFVNKLVDV